MTNHKYQNRRDIKFFEGTLSDLNTRDIIFDAFRKRDKKASLKLKNVLPGESYESIGACDANSALDNMNAVKKALTLPPLTEVNDPQKQLAVISKFQTVFF